LVGDIPGIAAVRPIAYERPMANESEQSFDGARDRLYSVEPNEFIAERGRLAKLLRADGQPAVAAEVQKLRRPSVAAWSINQAARADPHRVAEVFAAGEALEDAHRAASSGKAGTDVRDTARRRRALVDNLTERALQFAASLTPNPTTHRDAIEATWEAASIDPDVQPIVAAGWLAKELPRPSGFGLGATEPSTSKPATAPSPSRSAPPRDELALRRAQTALADARTELEDADEEVARADRDLRAAQETHEEATRRLADLEAAITAARADAREAAREAKAAEQAVTRAQASRDRASRKVDKSARAVEDRER
jgi:hypothetical protein